MVPNNLFWIARKACHHFAKHLPLNFNEWCQVVQNGLWERLPWACGWESREGEWVSLLPHSLPEKEGVQGEQGWDDSELWWLKEKEGQKGVSW